jgi:hypothetical protein
MTNTNTTTENISDKPTAHNLKIRIKYMLTHLIASVVMVGCLLMGLNFQNMGMIVFNLVMAIFNIYFFFRHYDKLTNAIEQLTASPNVSLEKT